MSSRKTFLLFCLAIVALGLSEPERITIDGIEPDAGLLSGGTRVLVRGGPFKGREREFKRPKCKFGSSKRIVNATYVRCTTKPFPPGAREPEMEEKNDVCIQCDNSPPGAAPEIIPFTVSLTGDFTDISNSIHYRYYPDVNSPESDVVNAPMPLSITMNDQQYSNKIEYWYYEFPSIYMLDPNRGPDTGGTHVLLKGNNFNPFANYPIKNLNDTFCRFGPLGTVPVQVINSTKIVCISPPSFILREVIVEVTLNNQEWTRDGNIFYYYRPPFVYDIEPLMGPVAGGTEVRVHGSNFEDTGKIRCKFGLNTVPGTYINVNELLCVSPRTDKPGYVPLQIAVYEDDFSSPDLVQYLYYDTPVIHSIDPICGPERGYTHITIRGQNFIDAGFDKVFCVFNKTIFMNATVYEPDTILCSSPPVLNSAGINENNVHFYHIEITFNSKDFSGPYKRFSYYKEVTFKEINPPGGPIEGGTLVKITGKGYKPECACNVTTRFGTFQVRPINYTENYIFVKSPNVTLSDSVVVSHGINGQQYNPDKKLNSKDLENTFSYYDQPVITAYAPRRGPSTGGTKIKFNGYGFTPYKDNEGKPLLRPVWIRMKKFGTNHYTAATPADFVDDNNVHWTTPPGEPESHHIFELSLNNQDFIPVLPINQSYSFTYFLGPHVTALYPPYGPVKSKADIMLIVKGKNFKCPNNKTDEVACRFGSGEESIYRKGTLVSETEIHCLVPKYNRPDVLPVEITLDGDFYTNDKKEYGFFDPNVWKVTPKMVSRKGNTTINIYGYGFVNTTGTYLKAKYGYLHKKLVCKGAACAVMATYIDKNNIRAKTFPYKDVQYEDTGMPLETNPFPVEVSVYGDQYTTNNVTIFYFTEPIYGDPIPNQAPANGNETILIPTDFLTPSTNPTNPENPEDIFQKYGSVKCRFKSITGKEVYTDGVFGHQPLRESENYNAVYCKSPKWDLPDGTDEENLELDISVNGGADYSGAKIFKITEKLDLYRIYPPCGPTYGNTKMTLVGTGMKKLSELHLKWGVVSSIFVDATASESLLYTNTTQFSSNPYEDEIISLNEEAKLLFKEKRKYEIVHSNSPRLPNWDRTHGGQVYLSLGRTTELQVFESKQFLIHNYGPSFMEYYYYKQPKMKDFRPRAGPTTGNTIVIIRGCWFKYMPEYGVIPYAKFGDKITRCRFESTVRIICLAPPNNDTDTLLPVDISLNGIDFTSQNMYYHYYSPPVIKDISPKSGPESGGSRVRLIGGPFSNLSTGTDFMCRFQAIDHKSPPKYIPGVYENSTSVICRTPGGWGSGNKVYIEVTFNGEEYTNSNSTFYFYSVSSATPRSGPSDGTAGNLHIAGSGFKASELVYCAFDGTQYKPLEVTWDSIICKIPRAKHGDDFFGTVPLEVSLNGVDSHKFEGGFQYYPQINVTDFYPRTGPAIGDGVVKFYGHKFRSDFALARPACKFGKYIGKAEVLSESEMLCHIPEIDVINTTYKGEVALNAQSFIKASSSAMFTPYGIYDIDPNSGPLGAQTHILLSGDGFSKEGKPKCRFGIPGAYSTVDGAVLSNKKMICLSPKAMEVPSVVGIPYSVPISVSFFEERMNPWTSYKAPTRNLEEKTPNLAIHFDPWTKSGHVFRFYTQPVIARITPNMCKVRDIIDVYAFATPKTPFVEPIAPTSELDMETGIKCSFGRFGSTPGVYVNSTAVRCVTPYIKDDPSTIREEHVHLRVAMNGHDYTAENDHTLFTFIGTKSLFSYWPYIIGIILGVLAIIALIMCCSSFWGGPKPVEEEPEIGERSKRRGHDAVPGIDKRPHTLRDEFGLYRTRGYFPDKQSPTASVRNTFLPRPSAIVNKQSLLTPKPFGK